MKCITVNNLLLRSSRHSLRMQKPSDEYVTRPIIYNIRDCFCLVFIFCRQSKVMDNQSVTITFLLSLLKLITGLKRFSRNYIKVMGFYLEEVLRLIDVSLALYFFM